MGQLRDAIHALIRAEYHFRYGKQAYQRIPERCYVEALEELYEVATGYKDLPSAFKALPVPILVNQCTKCQGKGVVKVGSVWIPCDVCTDPPELTTPLPRPQLKPGGFFK